MAANDVRQWDVGTVFTYTVLDANGAAEDLAALGATLANQRLVFVKPSGKKLIVTPAWGAAGDGTDGQLRHTSVAGDLDEPGTWYWGPALDLTDWDGRADYLSFVVNGNL